MLTDKQLKQLPTKEMIRCEVTGELVPIEDCEVIVIKIIKSKSSSLSGFNPFGSRMTYPQDVKKDERSTVKIEKDPTALTIEELTPAPRPRSVIPAGVLAAMREPGTPGEAVENRRV